MLTPKASPLMKKTESSFGLGDLDLLLKTIIERELNLARVTIPLRKEIQETRSVSTQDLFKLIDKTGFNSFSYQE